VVTTSVRREVVSFVKSCGYSERRACALIGLQRSTCQYRRRRIDDRELVERIHQLASERPRYGYRRLHVLLRREGRAVNRKLVYRLYKSAGLARERALVDGLRERLRRGRAPAAHA
jgi:putative transposase